MVEPALTRISPTMNAPRADGAWAYCTALTLLLAAPLSAFLIANRYPVFSSEAGLLVAACMGLGAALGGAVRLGARAAATIILGFTAALSIDFLYGLDWSMRMLLLVPALCMAVAWILREHLAVILSVISAVLLASILVLSPRDAGALTEVTYAPQEGLHVDQSKLPVILHLVLDEHIGIAGLPRELVESEDLARSLTTFYAERGFRIHTHAYSEYYDTRDSIPNLLNFSSEELAAAHLAKGQTRPLILKKSAYFSHLSKLGYRHHVYQSDYMDFCQVPDVTYSTCVTYSIHKLGSVHDAGLGTVERAKFILAAWLQSSGYWKAIESGYRRTRRAVPGLSLPEWEHGTARVGPIPVLPVIERLERDLRSASRGSVFFAHLLIPHYPYVLDESCRVRSQTKEWLHNVAGGMLDDTTQNTDATREERYRRYYAQLRCQQKQLLGLFDAMKQAHVWEDAIIVIHGDHGSRIVRRAPRTNSVGQMLPDDFRDAFSTLFAVRVWGREGRVLHELHSLQFLLGAAFGIPVRDAPPKVFLHADEGTALESHELVGF
jgi:hypothetical protein